MNWYFLVIGITWWGVLEFIRGHPSCPSSLNLLLTFLAPIGAILCVILSFVL